MQTLSVGLLLPTSTIRPMSKHFLKAFESSAKDILEKEGYELELVSEMIGTGSTQQVTKALDKFFGFHDVDIVTGIVSRYSIHMSLDKFQKRKVPFVFSNLGEQFTPSEGFNEYVLLNSIHLWQQVYALGYYAGLNGGKKGLAFCAMYDSGYAFLPAFEAGVRAADPELEYQFRLLPLPADGQLSNVKEAMSDFDLADYDFVFSLLCGEEAAAFIEEFYVSGLFEKTKLFGLPFLLETVATDLSGLEVFCPHHDGTGSTTDPLYHEVFKDLGTSTGRAIAQAFVKAGGRVEIPALKETFSLENPDKVYASEQSPAWLKPVGVYKHSFGPGNVISSELVWQKEVDITHDEYFSQMRDVISANWMNPYLGI